MAGLGTNVGTNFSLRARMMGSLDAGGQNLEVWYFAPGGTGMGSGFMGDRVLPSAHIEPIEGRSITVGFQNMSPMDHTIHLHGLDVDQQNDGVPTTSFAVGPMDSYDYTFVAPHAGTYHYHCHVDTVVHYAKGMYGAVIVRPPTAPRARPGRAVRPSTRRSSGTSARWTPPGTPSRSPAPLPRVITPTCFS